MPFAATWMHNDLFLIRCNFSVSFSDTYYWISKMRKSFSAGHKDQQTSEYVLSVTKLPDLSTLLRNAS